MRPLIKMSLSFLSLGADGVVFLLCSIGKPPRPRDQRMLRDIFLIARPSLLAVMQGGDFPLDAKIFTAPVTAPTAAYSAWFCNTLSGRGTS